MGQIFEVAIFDPDRAAAMGNQLPEKRPGPPYRKRRIVNRHAPKIASVAANRMHTGPGAYFAIRVSGIGAVLKAGLAQLSPKPTHPTGAHELIPRKGGRSKP